MNAEMGVRMKVKMLVDQRADLARNSVIERGMRFKGLDFHRFRVMRSDGGEAFLVVARRDGSGAAARVRCRFSSRPDVRVRSGRAYWLYLAECEV